VPAVEHPLINQISEQADETELGGKLPSALANLLLISRGEASRRIHEAADLGPRRALTGEPLQPVLPAFVGPRPDGTLGCHWDDDHENNDLSNLRWCTPLANAHDRARNCRLCRALAAIQTW
jgi:hypothetical protein